MRYRAKFAAFRAVSLSPLHFCQISYPYIWLQTGRNRIDAMDAYDAA